MKCACDHCDDPWRPDGASRIGHFEAACSHNVLFDVSYEYGTVSRADVRVDERAVETFNRSFGNATHDSESQRVTCTVHHIANRIIPVKLGSKIAIGFSSKRCNGARIWGITDQQIQGRGGAHKYGRPPPGPCVT